MKKVILWIRMLIYLPAVWLTAVQSRKESFGVRFSIVQKWTSMVMKRTGLTMITEGAEKVPADETVYFVSNHQGMLDPILVFAKLPVPATMVSKQSNMKIPFVNSWMKTMEAITFDRSNMRDAVRMIRDVVAKLNEGKNVVIFPEGTRSKKMEMGEFKPGSFKPALTAKCTVVPITLVNTFATDVKGKTDNRVKIIFSDPIRYEEFRDMTTTELCEKVQGIIQENLDRGL